MMVMDADRHSRVNTTYPLLALQLEYHRGSTGAMAWRECHAPQSGASHTTREIHGAEGEGDTENSAAAEGAAAAASSLGRRIEEDPALAQAAARSPKRRRTDSGVDHEEGGARTYATADADHGAVVSEEGDAHHHQALGDAVEEVDMNGDELVAEDGAITEMTRLVHDLQLLVKHGDVKTSVLENIKRMARE